MALLAALLLCAQDTPAPPQTTAQQDHQQMMDQLHITSLRPGADGSHPQAPNAANYDEAKANPYPNLPDPLVLKNGKKVKTAKVWWSKRRPEIVEDFDREVYGRCLLYTSAIVRATLRDQCPPDGGATSHAWLAGALVNPVLELEKTAAALAVHIIGNRGAAFLDGLR